MSYPTGNIAMMMSMSFDESSIYVIVVVIVVICSLFKLFCVRLNMMFVPQSEEYYSYKGGNRESFFTNKKADNIEKMKKRRRQKIQNDFKRKQREMRNEFFRKLAEKKITSEGGQFSNLLNYYHQFKNALNNIGIFDYLL
jgi:hypothetical protein